MLLYERNPSLVVSCAVSACLSRIWSELHMWSDVIWCDLMCLCCVAAAAGETTASLIVRETQRQNRKVLSLSSSPPASSLRSPGCAGCQPGTTTCSSSSCPSSWGWAASCWRHWPTDQNKYPRTGGTGPTGSMNQVSSGLASEKRVWDLEQNIFTQCFLRASSLVLQWDSWEIFFYNLKCVEKIVRKHSLHLTFTKCLINHKKYKSH